MDYQPIRPAATPRVLTSSSRSESIYWRKFKAPVFFKHDGPINSISYVPYNQSRIAPDADQSSSQNQLPLSSKQQYAISSSTKVLVYNARNQKVKKTISRFKEVVSSVGFRWDGKLIAAGDHSGLVQIFDVNSRAILRTMKGHDTTLPIRVSKFSSQSTQLLTASHDKTVRLWDIPSQEPLRVFSRHTDYVRAASVSPDNASLILSGSYDRTVKLWDSRVNENGGEVMSMEHGGEVEDCSIFPTGSGGMALSVGGPVLKAWDLMMGGRCSRSVSNHQKNITSLAITMHSSADLVEGGFLGSNNSGMRVLTAGLDQLVKIYDPSKDFTVTHTMRYPSPILCLALNPDESQLATGMSDGTLCVRTRELKASEEQRREETRKNFQNGSYEYFMNAQANLFGQGADGSTKAIANDFTKDDLRVESIRKRKLQNYDKLLKSFRYRDALDSSLQPGTPASTTFALLLELIHRSPGGPPIPGEVNFGSQGDGLKRAVSGRDDVTLEPLLKFLLKHATNQNYTEIICDTLNVVVDCYSSVLGQSPLIDSLFSRIWTKLSEEVKLHSDLTQVKGALEMVLSGSALSMAA